MITPPNSHFPPDTESDKYVKVMVYFATGVSILIFFHNIDHYYFISLNVVLFFVLFENDQNRSKIIVKNILETSFYFHKKAEKSVLTSIKLFLFAALSFSLSLIINMENRHFFICYFYTFLISMQIFLLSSSLKSFMLWYQIIHPKQVRRGFFGLFVRIVILVRKCIITPIWINYISSLPKYPKLVLFFYIIITIAEFGWLLNDLKAAFMNYIYSINEHLTEVIDPSKITYMCAVCMSEPTEPIELPCGHIHCYSCTYNWLKRSPTCPTCREPVLGTKLMDFSDGIIPFSVILFCF